MRFVPSKDGVVRGTQLFVGAFACMDTTAMILGASASQALWWVDARYISPTIAMLLPGALGILLVAAALAPPLAGARRQLTALACVLACVVSLMNALEFYSVWRAGLIRPAVPVPFSALAAAVFGLLAWWHARAAEPQAKPSGLQGAMGIAMAVVVWALLFPLAHVYFFGTTDYRRPADAAVVLGARVWPDGRLTTSLDDRVRTAVSLYDEGLVDTLIMSGGTGSEGVDEALAMRDRAVELGVPPQAIITDSEGVNTDATVANSLEIAEERGFERLLVVSQFYHLPRIELAYRAEGREVFTVPAMKTTRIAKTPLFVAREIPGFWVYWGRVWARDVLG